MYVPCTTELINIDENGKSELIIPTGTPCFHNFQTQFTITKILPFSWINLTNTNVSTFLEYKEKGLQLTTFNSNWNSSHYILNEIEPTENLSKRLGKIELEIPTLGYQETFSLIHIIFTFWLILQTLLLGMLIYCKYMQKPIILPQETENLGKITTNLAGKYIQEREVK